MKKKTPFGRHADTGHPLKGGCVRPGASGHVRDCPDKVSAHPAEAPCRE